MPELSLDFEVYCACGNGLCGSTSTSPGTYHRGPSITVEPCEKCMDAAADVAYNKGYDKGYEEAS